MERVNGARGMYTIISEAAQIGLACAPNQRTTPRGHMGTYGQGARTLRKLVHIERGLYRTKAVGICFKVIGEAKASAGAVAFCLGQVVLEKMELVVIGWLDAGLAALLPASHGILCHAKVFLLAGGGIASRAALDGRHLHFLDFDALVALIDACR